MAAWIGFSRTIKGCKKARLSMSLSAVKTDAITMLMFFLFHNLGKIETLRIIILGLLVSLQKKANETSKRAKGKQFPRGPRGRQGIRKSYRAQATKVHEKQLQSLPPVGHVALNPLSVRFPTASIKKSGSAINQLNNPAEASFPNAFKDIAGIKLPI